MQDIKHASQATPIKAASILSFTCTSTPFIFVCWCDDNENWEDEYDKMQGDQRQSRKNDYDNILFQIPISNLWIQTVGSRQLIV